MHSSRMRTARVLTVSRSIQGGLPNPAPPKAEPPGCRPPPPDTDPASLWTEGMTDACKNITLPQTSFVVGNN